MWELFSASWLILLRAAVGICGCPMGFLRQRGHSLVWLNGRGLGDAEDPDTRLQSLAAQWLSMQGGKKTGI